MPRFDYGTVGAYFITICAREKKKVFGRVVGGGVLDAPRVSPSPHGEIVIAQLEAMTNFYPDLQIEKYVVMPNRIHFIVVVTQGPSGASRTPSPTTFLYKRGLPVTTGRPLAVAQTYSASSPFSSRQAFMDRLMRLRSKSTAVSLTRTSSPTFSTSETLFTRSLLISLM